MKYMTKYQLLDKVIGKPVVVTFDRWFVMSEQDEFVGAQTLEDASDILREASHIIGEREINKYITEGMIGVKIDGDNAKFFVLHTVPSVFQLMTLAPTSKEAYYGNTPSYPGRYMGD
jgi:hypothetical protein